LLGVELERLSLIRYPAFIAPISSHDFYPLNLFSTEPDYWSGSVSVFL